MKVLLIKIYKHFNKKTNVNYCWGIRQKALSSRGILKYIYTYRWNRLIEKNNAFIPCSASFAEKPAFPHGFSGVFISSGANIGANCTIFHQVTIGSNTLADTKNPGAPTIGDNVYIGAGAKIIGGVHIGDNVRIGANCVVTKDVADNSTVVLAAPRVIMHTKERDNHFITWENSQNAEGAISER